MPAALTAASTVPHPPPPPPAADEYDAQIEQDERQAMVMAITLLLGTLVFITCFVRLLKRFAEQSRRPLPNEGQQMLDGRALASPRRRTLQHTSEPPPTLNPAA